MTKLAYSHEVKETAHQLYEFLLSCVREDRELTAVNVRAQMHMLGVAVADWEAVFRAARAEADYWAHEPPRQTGDDIDYSVPSQAMDVDFAIMEALWDLLEHKIT